MSLIRRAVAPVLERRGAPGQLEWGSSTPPSNGMLGGSVAGVTVTENTALQVAAVYGSVGVLADGVSTLPIRIASSKDPAKRTILPPSRLIAQPYSEISTMDWFVQFTLSLALRGNFFGEIIEWENTYPSQIKPIHPDRAAVRRLPGGPLEYRYNGMPIPLERVFHVRYLSVPGGLVGLNPIEYLRNILGLARAEDLYGAAWFANSATPSGTIEVEDDLDPDEVVELAKQWIAKHQGIGQQHLPAVLTGGAKFKAISINPEDSQFLQSRQFSQSVISGQIFRVPPHMIGIVDRSTSWGKGIEQQEYGFIRNTLEAYLSRAERALTALHPPGQFVEFDREYRTRGDRMERYQAYALAMTGGWTYPDEIRAEEGKPPLAEGQGKYALGPINSELLLKLIQEFQREKEAPLPVATPPPLQLPAGPKQEKKAASNGHGDRARVRI